MAVTSRVKRLIWIVCSFIFSVMKGSTSDVSATIVIGMNNTSALFECSKAVTLRCNAGTSFANWQIAYRFESGTSSSAQCFGSDCFVQNNFTGRYKFTYSSATGISDLQINPVVIEDDGREYKCNDGTQSPLRATVKLFPTNSSFALHKGIISEITHEVNFTLRLNCTADNVSITWYLTKENGIEIEIAATSTERYPCYDGECTSANTSAQISSNVELEETSNNNTRRKRLAERQTLGVNISYDLHKFHIPIEGSYKLKDIPIIKPKSEPMPGFPIKYIIIICVIVACCIAAIGVVIYLLRKRTHRAVDAPDTPTSFQQGTVAEESATFSCIPGLYRPGRQELVLSCHLVSGNDKHMVQNIQQLTDDVPRSVILMITNLRQGSVYDCFVYSRSARSASRRSNNSETIRIETLGLPNKPTHFQVLKVETNFIHLSWLPGEYRKDEQRFILEYTNMKTGDYSEAVIKMTKENQLTYTIEPLPAGTTYKVSLHAENNVGVSETVGPIEVTTQGNPDPPSEFRVVDSTHYSVTVIWKPGEYRRTTQTFIVNYGKAKKNIQAIRWKQKKRDDDQNAVMTCTIDNLQPRTKYAFFLFAQNDIGVSLPTKIIRSKTEGENSENNVQRSKEPPTETIKQTI